MPQVVLSPLRIPRIEDFDNLHNSLSSPGNSRPQDNHGHQSNNFDLIASPSKTKGNKPKGNSWKSFFKGFIGGKIKNRSDYLNEMRELSTEKRQLHG